MGVPMGIHYEGATVEGFGKIGPEVRLQLKGFRDPDREEQVLIIVSPVTMIKIDDEMSASVTMEAQDGEIIELEISPNGVFVIIEWIDYSRTGGSRFSTKAYEISGETVTVSEEYSYLGSE